MTSNNDRLFDLVNNLLSDMLVLIKKINDQINYETHLYICDNKSPFFIVGDIHSDYTSLRKIILENQIISKLEKNEKQKIVFLGDYIDRGDKPLETLMTLFELKIRYPYQVHLIRGNHEGPKDLPCYPNDFRRKLTALFREKSEVLYNNLQKVFDELLTCVYIENQALLVHGGLPNKVTELKELANAAVTHPEKSYLEELLWSDPCSEPGVYKSPRGAGKLFGSDVTRGYEANFGVRSIIRSHESPNKGYKVDHGSVLTIFSSKASKYSGNECTYLSVQKDFDFSVENLKKCLVTF